MKRVLLVLLVLLVNIELFSTFGKRSFITF